MLDRLRDRATKLLAQTRSCTLATSGPAGVQASIVPCKHYQAEIYLLIPDASDHLFNLEHEPTVALSTESWTLRGSAEIVGKGVELFQEPQAQWHIAVKIRPQQMHILPGPKVKHAQTIDFD